MNTNKRPIDIIVPIYNGFEVFTDLLGSLKSIYTNPRDNLKFIFIDDCSPDPRIQELLTRESFFDRPDVIKRTNFKNLGFIGTVNIGIDTSNPSSDILILNTDTQIFSDFASELQKVALENPNVGTVTPLTNSGTIASLFNFPEGGSIPEIFSKEKISDAIKSLSLPCPQISAPTGVGFAMYITREMIQSVGILDPIFGKGYGEECDWCQRATTRGFQHLIATNCFVYHKGSESFGSAIKQKLIETNSKILSRRHPNYDNDVAKYISLNPLSLSRALLITELVLQGERPKNGVIHILHAPLDVPNAGGTEKHVDWLTNTTPESISIILAPQKESSNYAIQIKFKGYRHTESVSEPQAVWFLNRYLRIFDTIHVHHTLRLSSNIFRTVLTLAKKLIISVHDFYFICPSINLLTARSQNVFCYAETDANTCNNCLQNYYSIKAPIELHRRNSLQLFDKASAIIFPSESTLNYYLKIFPTIDEKSHVVGHDLSHYPVIDPKMPKERNKPVVVFLGAIGKHKGANLALLTANKLSKNFSVEFWGALDVPHGQLKKGIPVKSYKSTDELLRLFESHTPNFVVIPSISAETFCYSFYETILMSNAIPIVSPLGNPATTIRKYDCGIVFEEFSPDAIEKAIHQASSTQTNILRSIKKLRTALQSETNRELLLPSFMNDAHLSYTPPTSQDSFQPSSLTETTQVKFTTTNRFIQIAKYLVRRNKYTYWLGTKIYRTLKRLRF